MGYLLCPLCCGRSFLTRKSLQYHLLAAESNVACPECNQRFDTIVDLANHLELDTCEQMTVVISVSGSPLADSRTRAVSDSHSASSNKNAHDGKFQQIPMSPSEIKEEFIDSPQSTTEETEEWIVDDGAILSDESTKYEVALSDVLNVSHDTDMIEQWEQEVPGEGVEHFCNSCNCKVQGIVEHIKEFHASETVVLQNAAICGENEDEDVGYTSDSLTSVRFTGSASSTTNTVGSENVCARESKKATIKPIGKPQLPKVYDTVDESNMVDVKTGIPYVRRIVHIEKFWETEPYRSAPKGAAEEWDAGESEVALVVEQPKEANLLRVVEVTTKSKKQTAVRKDAVRKTHVSSPGVKVPPKMKKDTLIQAHINQLLRSRAIDTLKQSCLLSEQSNEDILQKLLTAANEAPTECIDASSSPPTSSQSKIKDEDRSTIIKFVSDSTDIMSESTIPVFLCSVCDADFSDPHQFAAHKCKIPKIVLPTLCDICGVRCKSNRNLQAHMESHDPKSKAKKLFAKQVQKLLSEPATCDICNTEFTTAGGLKVHKRMHRPDNVQKVAEMNNKVEYQCNMCNMVCYSKRTARIHYKVHLNCSQQTTEAEQLSPPVNTPNVYDDDLLTCKLCCESFTSNEELKSHWQGHYPVGSRSTVVAAEETVTTDALELVEVMQYDDDGDSFTCTKCGKRLAEGLREIHEKMHRGETPFGCSVCNKHFPTEVNLEFHMATHRTNIELECLTCKTKFMDPALLKLHRKTHASLDRPYPCGFCGRRFSRPHEKVKHERIHTGEKPYECSICGMKFRVGYCLKMHERIHTGVRPYSCEHCGRTFRARSGYKQHIRLHSDVRAFICPFCPKTFKTVVQLAGHKKSHTKPYSCPHCGRRFATMYMVRAHVNTHAKSSLKHSCYICGASYGRDYALKDHIKTHGKNVPPPPDDEDDPAMELTCDLSNDVNNL